jgi:ion channel-forming bestrophin family protein
VIEYSRKSWWQITLTLHGTVLPNVLGRVGFLTGFSLALCLLNARVLTRYSYPLPALDQLGHTVLGVALSMLISSRTTASNNRYWEGRQCWGGIVNASRNLARLGAVYAGPAEELAGLIAAYVIAVRENLRGHKDLREVYHLLPGYIAQQATDAASPSTILSKFISQWIQRRRSEGAIDVYQAMTMEGELNRLIDNQGGCERIQKTPLPFVYAALIKQVLMVYLVTLPFVLVAKMGFAAPMVVAVVSLGMLGIEEAGVEVEDPFGTEPNSLPLEDICDTIGRDVRALCAAAAAEH